MHCHILRSFAAVKKLLLLALPIWLLLSCSDYNQVLKSADAELKFTRAVEYYNKKDYVRCYPLFEELLNLYRGTAKAEEVYYYYSYTHFGQEDFMLAAYHFKNFSKTFPNSTRADECAYMAAYCYYLDSPEYSLDQASTYKAINELQLFIDQHPKSEKVRDCTELIDKCRKKLEKKSFEIAKQYRKIEDYKSCIITMDNLLNDFPDTEFREEALYLQLDSYYFLAMKSIESKKEQRLKETIAATYQFEKSFPNSSHIKEVRDVRTKTEEELEKVKEVNNGLKKS